MTTAADVLSNYQKIRAQIEALDPQTPVTLLAVSKKKPAALIQHLIDEISDLQIGENYVQEFAAKKLELTGNYTAHLIGALQSNKANDAVKVFDVIQSVDRPKILKAIIKAASSQNKVQDIYLQVNISADPAKSGFTPGEAAKVYVENRQNKQLNILGLMTITAHHQDEQLISIDYQNLATLRDTIDGTLKLSMGMSADYPLAIAAGSNLVRVGTAIFGPRHN